MQPFNRIYYSSVYWRLNMFRAAHRSSSGALNCIWQPLVLHRWGVVGRVVAVRWLKSTMMHGSTNNCLQPFGYDDVLSGRWQSKLRGTCRHHLQGKLEIKVLKDLCLCINNTSLYFHVCFRSIDRKILDFIFTSFPLPSFQSFVIFDRG
jgi:hypothetical protein